MDKALIEKWKLAVAEIDAAEQKKVDFESKHKQLSNELKGLIRTREAAEESKEGALIAFSKGDITQAELDTAWDAFAAADRAAGQASEVLPLIEQEIFEIAHAIPPLHQLRIETEKEMWWTRYNELRDEIQQLVGDKVHMATLCLAYAGKVFAPQWEHQLHDLFGKQKELKDRNHIGQSMILEWQKMKV